MNTFRGMNLCLRQPPYPFGEMFRNAHVPPGEKNINKRFEKLTQFFYRRVTEGGQPTAGRTAKETQKELTFKTRSEERLSTEEGRKETKTKVRRQRRYGSGDEIAREETVPNKSECRRFDPIENNKYPENSYYKALYSTNIDKHHLNNKKDRVAREGIDNTNGLTQGPNNRIYN